MSTPSSPANASASSGAMPVSKPVSSADWRFHISAGLDLDFSGKPAPLATGGEIETKSCKRVARVALGDMAVKPDILVKEGQNVSAGDAPWRDRRHPEIQFTAPASGTVAAINRGKKRKLISVAIDVDATQPRRTIKPPADTSAQTVRTWLMDTGHWALLRSRPFGVVPPPNEHALALFVTATPGDPLAPAPDAVARRYGEAFHEGLKLMLYAMGGAPVFLCAQPEADFPAVPGQIRRADFSGSHASALPGTHIHSICPVSWHGGDQGLDGTAWHIGYQDVIAIGFAALSGGIWTERIASIAGPQVKRPRTLAVPLGGHLSELLDGELLPGLVRILSGGPVNGRAAFGTQEYLSPRHIQITALAENRPATQGGTAMGGHPGAVLPVPDIERAWAFDIPPTPLMRALATGDGETVRALGGLALVEEDVAALTFACPSKTEYGVLLRRILNDIHKTETSAEAGA